MVARGMIPGSMKAVFRSVTITTKKSHPAIAGIAGDSSLNRKGQLKKQLLIS